jgi:hypothetical protein
MILRIKSKHWNPGQPVSPQSPERHRGKTEDFQQQTALSFPLCLCSEIICYYLACFDQS